jgi:hypothetical protein
MEAEEEEREEKKGKALRYDVQAKKPLCAAFLRSVP